MLPDNFVRSVVALYSSEPQYARATQTLPACGEWPSSSPRFFKERDRPSLDGDD